MAISNLTRKRLRTVEQSAKFHHMFDSCFLEFGHSDIVISDGNKLTLLTKVSLLVKLLTKISLFVKLDEPQLLNLFD